MKGWDHVTHMTELEKRCASLWFKINPATVEGPITGLLVGEMPGKNTRSALPLFPYPKNSSGGRLLAMSGIPPHLYFARMMRVNLFEHHVDIWNEEQANLNAIEIMKQQPKGRRVVLCGRRVGSAFGFTQFFQMGHDEEADAFYVAIPHPSGLNREYNDPIKRASARIALQWAADYMVPPPKE
jgi:hypothetical protein